MKELILKNSSGKTVLLLIVITGISFLIMPVVTMPKVIQFTNGMKILDLMPGGYDFEYVNTLLRTLGEEGRHNYLFYQIPVDMVYPLLFTITSCLLIAFLLNKLQQFRNPFIYLCIFPVISGIADYSENIGVAFMLNQYPDISTTIVKITSMFSVIKYTSITITFLGIIVLGIILGVKRIIPNIHPNER